MSDFRRYLNFVKKSQHDQISELRKWSDSFSLGPAIRQTKPNNSVSVKPASPATQVLPAATDARDEDKTALVVNNFGDEGKVTDDEVFAFGEDDQQLSRQIVKKEKKLLHIWENGPAQLTMSQDMRIAYLEEKLEKAYDDNKYLEALLEVRNRDFARYYNLHWKEKIEGENLAERVDVLLAELEKKDHIIISMQVKLDCIREAERISQELIFNQKQLAKSTLALLSKQRKTKMASAHSVQTTATRPRPPVQEEITMADKREWERRKEEQRKEIIATVNHVDRIAASYDRYQNVSSIITCSEPRSEIVPDHLFTWMEHDMIALWLFTVEPTMEEQEKYEKHLEKQMRPDPIYSPTLSKLHVNWMRLNTNMFKNLPQPTRCTVYGCSQDPAAYTRTYRTAIGPENVFGDGVNPFGALYGFHTDEGVVDLPDIAIHGYKFDVTCSKWVIAASMGY